MRATLVLIFLLFAACTDRSFTPILPQALEVGSPVQVLAVTSRVQDEKGVFSFGRAEKLGFLDITVSVPPSHKAGIVDFAYGDPDPLEQFTLAGQEGLESDAAFVDRLRSALDASRSREIVVFVHGYNYTQAEAAFRSAQMARDFDHGGVSVIYSWPSKGHVLGYAYDIDSMFFARDGLERTLELANRAGAERVVLVAHSMGGMLSMETLRNADTREPGWSDNAVDAVILMSPDIDVDVFRTQMRTLKPAPKPFFVFASQKDRILNISGRLRGAEPQSRLGRVATLDKVADLPIEIIDTTAFNADAGSGHFVAGTSPTLLAILRRLPSMTGQIGPDSPSLFGILTGQPADTHADAAIMVLLQPNRVAP